VKIPIGAMQRLIRVLCVLLAVSVTSTCALAESESVIATVTDPAARSTLGQKAEELLSSLVPQEGKSTAEGTSQITDGQYLLWGELFEKGRTQAVVALGTDPHAPTYIALADWEAQKGNWKVSQIIRLPIYWKSPAVLESGFPVVPDNLPAKASWVMPFDPSLPRLLVVSTPHSQYRAGHFVFTYDAKAHQLDASPDFSVAEPAMRAGYVVLTNDSGRKAHWSEESYYTFEQGRLKFRGSLRSGSYDGDDIHIHVGFTEPGSPSVLTWRFSAPPEDQSNFKIQAGDESNPGDPVLGNIHFLKPASGETHGAYLLNKLTGLPTTLVPTDLWDGRDPQEAPVSTLTDGYVQVTGNDKVMRLLGPASAVKPEKGK
jgi:hypothetical protein